LLVEIAKNKDLVAILAALRGVGALTNKLEVDSSTANEQAELRSSRRSLSSTSAVDGDTAGGDQV